MRYSVSWSQDCTVAVGKVTEMTTGIREVANQRVKIARQLHGDYPNYKIFDEILTFLTEENAAIAESLDAIKAVDILAMLFISILSQVSQFNLEMMTMWVTLSWVFF